MLLNAGKKLKEACAARAIPARFTCHCYLPNQSGKLEERDCSCLVSFSTTFSLSYLDRPSMGAEVGRFERFVSYF